MTTNFSSPRSMLALLVVLGGAAVGCQSGAGADSVDQATQLLSDDGASADAADQESTGALTDATFDAVSSAEPAASVSALVAAPLLAVDAGCRTRAKDPNDPAGVIITLHDCTGRFGVHHVSGEELVHFSKGEGGVLHADFHSEGLTVDGRPASHTASADVTFASGARHVAWQGSWSTVDARGAAVDHTSDLTIDVDTSTHCRTRNGTGATTVGGREIDSSVQDLVVCRDADGDAGCPTGTVIHTGKASGKSLTVSFDGSDQASVTTPRGQTFDRGLTCQE